MIDSRPRRFQENPAGRLLFVINSSLDLSGDIGTSDVALMNWSSPYSGEGVNLALADAADLAAALASEAGWAAVTAYEAVLAGGARGAVADVRAGLGFIDKLLERTVRIRPCVAERSVTVSHFRS